MQPRLRNAFEFVPLALGPVSSPKKAHSGELHFFSSRRPPDLAELRFPLGSEPIVPLFCPVNGGRLPILLPVEKTLKLSRSSAITRVLAKNTKKKKIEEKKIKNYKENSTFKAYPLKHQPELSTAK